MTINDKIKQVLTVKQLSPSQLADNIGVQRSSISHILSGRNRPSLDVIQKIVRCYTEFSYEWFLEDDSQLSTELSERSHSDLAKPAHSIDRIASNRRNLTARQPTPVISKSEHGTNIPERAERSSGQGTDKQIDRILIFYTDGTFREYKPS